jgi:hypothetical protein
MGRGEGRVEAGNMNDERHVTAQGDVTRQSARLLPIQYALFCSLCRSLR